MTASILSLAVEAKDIAISDVRILPKRRQWRAMTDGKFYAYEVDAQLNLPRCRSAAPLFMRGLTKSEHVRGDAPDHQRSPYLSSNWLKKSPAQCYRGRPFSFIFLPRIASDLRRIKAAAAFSGFASAYSI